MIRPFKAIRPAPQYAAKVASLPYDVMDRAEAKAMVEGKEHSFLRVVRSEVNLPDTIKEDDPFVYREAERQLEKMQAESVLFKDQKKSYYLYRLQMGDHVQTGLVAGVLVDAYLDSRVKRHELTRSSKEQDRIRHFVACQAQTAPVFLAYRHREKMDTFVQDYCNEHSPVYDFKSEDGIIHQVWQIEAKSDQQKLESYFQDINYYYIADGHHRAASAVRVASTFREIFGESENIKPKYNHFMAVLFPENQLKVMDYNRVVKDLNGLSSQEFLAKLEELVSLEESAKPFKPQKKGEYGMYLDGKWYSFSFKAQVLAGKDQKSLLDVELMQTEILDPILGVKDPRTDQRIDFVGGIRGLEELERRVNSDMKLAFSFYPTSMTELFTIADMSELMPPKSTWFEPKLRSGLFVYSYK